MYAMMALQGPLYLHCTAYIIELDMSCVSWKLCRRLDAA